MKKFIGKLPTKTVPFMDGEVEIRKLSAGAVKRIGAASKVGDASDEDMLAVLAVVLSESVVLEEGEEAITPAMLEEFPLDEISKLSNAIMEYAGVATVGSEGNASA